MDSFWRIYAIAVTVMLGGIQFAQWQFPPSAPSEISSVRIQISVPPKPKGVQQNQNEGGDQVWYTEEGCLAQSQQFYDVCFHQLARQKAQTDLKGALEACRKIRKEDTIWECYADAAELYSLVDREESLATCPNIEKKKWRDQCVFGIALTWSTKDSPWAFRLCDQAGQWRDFCRHDVNGEIAVVNSALALQHCAAEEGDLLTRKTCWHGIGKYIARVDVQAAFSACEKVPAGPNNLYRENCIHGLGWGASESAKEEFVKECQRAGNEQDSCLLGVAYNLRRFDIDAGLRICEQVQRQDLHQQCRTFVSNGRL